MGKNEPDGEEERKSQAQVEVYHLCERRVQDPLRIVHLADL